MKYTNIHNLPESLVNCIENDTYYLNQADPNIISVTTLISEPKIRQLKVRHWNEIEEDISDKIWILLGQSVHSILDRVNIDNSLKEERITVDVNGIKISGKSDLFYKETILDYKVTSVWSIIYNPEGKKEWEEQLNCYAWLYRKLGFTVKGLKIIGILRDWSMRDLRKSKKNYPKIPVSVIDIQLWSEEEQEAFIKERIEEHQKYISVPDDEIPCCKETWNDKRCKDYCSVNKFCNYYNKLIKG